MAAGQGNSAALLHRGRLEVLHIGLRLQRHIAGFALWWDTELVPGVQLSTSPFEPPTHWEQIYLPLLKPVDLDAGDIVELTLTCDTRPEVGVRLGWKTRQLRGGKAVAEQSQDSLRGRL